MGKKSYVAGNSGSKALALVARIETGRAKPPIDLRLKLRGIAYRVRGILVLPNRRGARACRRKIAEFIP